MNSNKSIDLFFECKIKLDTCFTFRYLLIRQLVDKINLV